MTSDILNLRLPNIELSYEKLLHRKVQADIYRINPKGVRCLIWYTYWKENNVCFILHINNSTGSIKVAEKTIACFSDTLCYGKGTILGGVLFQHNKTNVVSVDNIYYYKGKEIIKTRNEMKLKLIFDLLKNETQQTIFIRSQLLVAMPMILQNYDEALTISKTLSYPIHSISILNYVDYYSVGYYHYIGIEDKEAVFIIKPQVKCDTYDLYVLDQATPYGIAAITDYKTSVMMNKIFRNVKENFNLDFLEQSDSDEEFENISKDKHVEIKKTALFRCVYISRFKKWKPVSICNLNNDAFTKKQVIMLEKNRS